MNNLFDDSLTALLATIFVALVLATAAFFKLRHQDEFQGVVENYRLLPAVMVPSFARTLPWLELLVAVALLIPLLQAVAAWVAAMLFLMFALALAINVGRGRTYIDCGCVRRPTSASRIGMFHVVRALALAGVSLYIATVPVAFASITLQSGLLALAGASMLAMLYLAADVMVGLPNTKLIKN